MFCVPLHCCDDVRCVFIALGASRVFIVCNNIRVLLSTSSITNCRDALMDLLAKFTRHKSKILRFEVLKFIPFRGPFELYFEIYI